MAPLVLLPFLNEAFCFCFAFFGNDNPDHNCICLHIYLFIYLFIILGQSFFIRTRLKTIIPLLRRWVFELDHVKQYKERHLESNSLDLSLDIISYKLLAYLPQSHDFLSTLVFYLHFLFGKEDVGWNLGSFMFFLEPSYCDRQNNVPHKGAHVLIPRTYEYTLLCSKGELRLNTKSGLLISWP